MSPPKYDQRRTSVAADGSRKRGGIPWLLVALAVIAAIILVVLLLSCGSDDDKKSAGSTTTTATSTSGSGQTPPAAGTTAGAGTLTAGGASLLAATAPDIKSHIGENAVGEGVKVLSTDGSGFFVGTDESDRQFVEFGGRVGGTEANSEKPAVGDTVRLSGPVRPAPEDPAKTLKLSADAAQAVTERGAYINANTVTPTG